MANTQDTANNANIASEQRILNTDIASLEHNDHLITALATQLTYYFSSQNLSKDTYLNTIMQLNSGFVPTSILSGFSNVNRIIARFTGGDINLSDLDVQRLLRKSVHSSKALTIVSLDQNGKVVSSHGDDEFEANKGVLTFEGIGSCSDFCATAKVKNEESSSEEDEKKSSTVILRDVPDIATVEDIRCVFKSDDTNAFDPNITSVQKEVGQCWFVTIDSSTSQQDLVSILLNLRTKRICDEPIKARLKTQSTATQGVPMQGGSWNPYRSKYHGYNNSNQYYSGDRLSFSSRKFSNRQYSKQRGNKGGDYSGIYKGDEEVQKKVSKVKKAGPPPPLVEEHFPGLSGSPKSTIANNSCDENSNEHEGKREVLTNSGYAAALLKAAPQMPDVSTLSENLQNEKNSLQKSPARKKFDDSKSTGTVSTDGSSADDKSSTSKSEFEPPSTAAPCPVKTWGRGPSFADILKKQEAGTN